MSQAKMDAKAILTSQGWRGPGHSLHPTCDNTGLKHHLLIKREGNDGRGLGSKKDHKQEAWWMNAFDQALKGIDTSSGSMKQTVSDGNLALGKIAAKGATKYTGSRGLYTCFVRGGTLVGTVGANEGLLTPPDSGAGTPAAEQVTDSKKEAKKGTKEEREKARKLKKAQKLARKEVEAKAAKAGETKEQRKARREARRARKEEKRRKRSEG